MNPPIKHRLLALLLVVVPGGLAFMYPMYFLLALVGVVFGIAAYGLYRTVLCWITGEEPT